MDYKLAKQLKDAGFRQNHRPACDPEEAWVSFPDLVELIEACRVNGNYSVHLHVGVYHPDPENDHRYIQRCEATAIRWPIDGALEETFNADGDTAEEAVAKLWLALYPKA